MICQQAHHPLSFVKYVAQWPLSGHCCNKGVTTLFWKQVRGLTDAHKYHARPLLQHTSQITSSHLPPTADTRRAKRHASAKPQQLKPRRPISSQASGTLSIPRRKSPSNQPSACRDPQEPQPSPPQTSKGRPISNLSMKPTTEDSRPVQNTSNAMGSIENITPDKIAAAFLRRSHYLVNKRPL